MNTKKEMALPLTEPTNWTSIGTWAVSVTGILIAFIAFTNKYFKDKAEEREAYAIAQKQEKQEFIEKVVIATVTATLNSTLGDIKSDIEILFKYREEDKREMNNRFDRVMVELKK